MTTTQSQNVYPLAIETDFDGCQNIVKKMFLDEDFQHTKVRFIAANSINWARCMTQSVYFFWSYLRLKEIKEDLTFSIPSGNFGHPYARWTAKEMGLPIKRLIIATNENDVLHQTFSNNLYAQKNVVQTLAPSMDISVASNFERLLYNLYDNNSSLLAKNMRSFPEKSIDIPDSKIDAVSNFFKSHCSNDQEIIKQIMNTHQKIGYLLDPHTATGVKASNEISTSNEPVVTMGTAHPAKFSEAIEKAIPDYHLSLPKKVEKRLQQEEQFNILEENYEEIKSFVLSKAL